MRIIIDTLDHSVQRYDTAGDYWIDQDSTWQIRVSKMDNWKMELLIALHELYEMSLCFDKGIKEEDITKFDVEFEAKRLEGNLDEPGDDKNAPYYNEHQIATIFEKESARIFSINYDEYTNIVNNL